MEIIKNLSGNELTLKLVGRLDTTTAGELEAAVSSSLDGVTTLTFDFSELEYISSAGLRVLLSTQKTMQGKGKMIIANPNEMVNEVFDITGFATILTIVNK
uniref:Anti-sigma factor antagonist n=1 Tax=uncultured bacterium fosmid pJB84G2 TaxID=1478072 RepID=A0A0H3U8A3_9BACT|nr:hypothetical protein [uncultured bacterium fosmid pJB84G2]